MIDAAPAEPRPLPSRAGYPPAARHVALVVLFAVGTLNFVDRQILSVLVEPIKAELHLSDTQFGLLTGLSFALFYAVMGVPVALLADRTHRVRLIAAACFIWSCFTAACGMAGSFTHLMLARFGVGVGEAGGTPPSLSILADYYPPERRALITGVFVANGPLGVLLGTVIGGGIAQAYGWRSAFFVLAALGIVAAPLLLIFVREPRRGAHDGHAADAPPAPAPSFLATAGLFRRKRSLGLLLVAAALSNVVSYGILSWTPAFLMRTQGMSLRELTAWFGLAAGLSFGLGIWGGGAVVSRFAARSPRTYALVPGISIAIVAPTFVAALLASSWQASLALLIVPMALSVTFTAPALALVANLAPHNARATASAMLMLVFNLVGMGGGPLLIGMISDAMIPRHGVESLRIALLWIAPIALLAAAAQYAVSRAVRHDLATG